MQRTGSGHDPKFLQRCQEALHLALQVPQRDLQVESEWLSIVSIVDETCVVRIVFCAYSKRPA